MKGVENEAGRGFFEGKWRRRIREYVIFPRQLFCIPRNYRVAIGGASYGEEGREIREYSTETRR